MELSDLRNELVALRRQNTDLQEANNRLLRRARDAEASLKQSIQSGQFEVVVNDGGVLYVRPISSSQAEEIRDAQGRILKSKWTTPDPDGDWSTAQVLQPDAVANENDPEAEHRALVRKGLMG